MADEMLEEVLEETQTEVPTESPTEGTTGGRYLTKTYLVRNLQKFWTKIKEYTTDQIKDFVSTTAFDTALNSKADQTDLDSLQNVVNDKVSNSSLTEALADKVDTVEGKALSTNDFTTDDKNKLDGIAEKANNYSHPTNSGNKHIPSGGNSGQILRWDSDGTAVWGRVPVGQSLDAGTDDPVAGKVINAEFNKIREALANKVDKEDDPLDPSGLIDLQVITSYSTAEGHIVLKFPPKDTGGLKIYTPKSDKPIETVSVWDGSTLLFTNFQQEDDGLAITIENPEGKTGDEWNTHAYIPFNFYIENFTYNNKKYKPFVLQAERSNQMDLTITELSIIKIFES